MLNKAYIPFKFKVDKAESGDMTFSAYGNVKNIKDHAWDIAVDGCYQASIDKHKADGTSPRLLWSHNPYELPVGKITSMVEDEHGLKFEGKLSNTTQGKDIYELLKDGGLDSFSIGYKVVEEEWNSEAKANILMEIDLKEISFVNFACNEMSLLQDVKSHLEDGELPTKRELQNFLRGNGLSKSQAEKITNQYEPVQESKCIFDEMAKKDSPQESDIFDIMTKTDVA